MGLRETLESRDYPFIHSTVQSYLSREGTQVEIILTPRSVAGSVSQRVRG